MGNGLEGLFFVLVLLFWVLETVASARRKRRAQAEFPDENESGETGSGEVVMRPLPERSAPLPAPTRSGSPTRVPLPERTGRYERSPIPAPPPVRGRPGDEESAEGMLPRDLWEELEGMVRGPAPLPQEVPRAPVPEAPRSRVPEVPEPALEERRGSMEARREQGHGLESRRRDGGRSTPAPRAVVGSDEARRSRHTPAAVMAEASAPAISTPQEGGRGRDAFRTVFGGPGRANLRRAVLLREVLGPPLALREPPGPDLQR